MSDTNSQNFSSSMTVIPANINGITASKASMLSARCKKEHCHCLCPQDTHRVPHLARPKTIRITLIAERLHIKYFRTILIGSDMKVKSLFVWEKDNVELISIEMNRLVVHSVYRPQNGRFVPPAS